jgi:hypothetical protein
MEDNGGQTESAVRSLHRTGQRLNAAIGRGYENWSKYGVKKIKGFKRKTP